MYLTISKKIKNHAYVLKHNSTRENQVILLMITDNEKWHYPALFHKITSKHDGDFYFLNCFHTFRAEN